MSLTYIHVNKKWHIYILVLGRSCNFETGLCGFVQLTSDQFDWTRRRGATPTIGTGPISDHTTGTGIITGLLCTLKQYSLNLLQVYLQHEKLGARLHKAVFATRREISFCYCERNFEDFSTSFSNLET